MDKKIKIGLFIDTFYPMVDGVIMVVDNYAKRLCENHDVTVFTVKSIDKTYVDNFPYKVVRCKAPKVLPFLDYTVPAPKFDRKFKKILKHSDLDVVHIHSPFGLGKQGVKYARKHNIPVVSTLHSQFKKDFYRATKSKFITNILLSVIMRVFNKCDECWAVNEEIAQIFKEYGAKELPGVQYNGTEMTLIADKKKADKIVNEKYGIKADEIVFLFVGRINILKNIIFIADALKIAKDKGLKFKMIYAGTGQDEDRLKSHIKDIGLEDDVIYAGKVTDREFMAALYSRAHLFLFPSLYDANSIVQIEAASQKTPGVFIEGAPTASTITSGVNGIIAKNDVNDYASEIINICSDKEKYEIISEGAYRDIYRSWDKTVAESFDRYMKIRDKKTKK